MKAYPRGLPAWMGGGNEPHGSMSIKAAHILPTICHDDSTLGPLGTGAAFPRYKLPWTAQGALKCTTHPLRWPPHLRIPGGRAYLPGVACCVIQIILTQAPGGRLPASEAAAAAASNRNRILPNMAREVALEVGKHLCCAFDISLDQRAINASADS